ncbi:MAG: LLM class flavin-dependent oxidoreductase [Acidimicrobiia bacterium]
MRYLVMPRPWDGVDLPGPWAAEREAEGWHGLAVGDHWYLDGVGGCLNPFVVLGDAAARTSTIGLSTAYANNLARHPVELAQAALSVQFVSGGRFELGIGTGWAKREILGAGLAFPSPRERIERLRETIHIARQLFAGACAFHGRHYDVELPAAGVSCPSPPALSAALAGPIGMRTIGPLVDIIELSTPGLAFRQGETDMAAYGATRLDDIKRLIDRARNANPDAAIGLSLYVAAGRGRSVEHWQTAFGHGCYKGLAGEPREVADTIRNFAALDVDRITVMPPFKGTAAALAPHLLGGSVGDST